MTFRIFLLALLSLVHSSQLLAEELVVYSGREAKFVQPLLDEFSKQTGIQINLQSGHSSILLSKLSLRGEASGVDLYLGNDVGNLQRGSDYGLFRPLPAELTGVVSDHYLSPHKDWVGLSARLRVLVVSTRPAQAQKIGSILDLANPALKGRIAITHTNNESFISGVSSYRPQMSPEKYQQWLDGLKANIAGNYFNKHSQIVKAVAEGKKDVGLVNHYYALRYLKQHPDAPIKLVMPDQGDKEMGTALNLAGIAITRFSKHSKAAVKLVAFLLSAEQQKRFAEMNQEYPTRNGVPLAQGVPSLASVHLSPTSMTEIGRLRETVISDMHRAGLY